jgi:hypothetical protein
MSLNRRKFLSTTILSLVGVGLYGSTSLRFDSFSKNVSLDTIPQLLKKAAIKRKAGELLEAKSIYQQIISINVSEIRAFDGLRKTLLLEKFKELEVLQLYNFGLKENPASPIFKERLAKEYMRLALGNKKFANQLDQNANLLEVADSVFLQLKNENPNKRIYQELHSKASLKIKNNANLLDARNNLELKKQRKQNKEDYKKRYDNLSTDVLELKLSNLLSKPFTDNRKKHIAELYIIIIAKYSRNNDSRKVIQKLNSLYQFNPNDVNTLKLIRKFCKKYSKLSVLEKYERKNDDIKESFWSKIALIDTLILRFKKDRVGSINEIQDHLDIADTLKSRPTHHFEINSRKFKISIIKGNRQEAKNNFISFSESIRGISSAHYLDRYNLLCVRYFKKFGDFDSMMESISISLNELNKEPEDELMKMLYELNLQKDNKSKMIHNQRLLKIRNKIISRQFQ